MQQNKTVNVMFRLFDKESRMFVNKFNLDLAAVPNKGDKLTVDLNHWSHIAEVYEVVFADDGMVDVNALLIGTEDDIVSGGYPDIDISRLIDEPR